MSSDTDVDVLIIGAGPVGLTLAAYLVKYGLTCVIIDKREPEKKLKRAIAVNTSSLLALDGLGLADKLIAKGEKIDNLTIYWQLKRLMNINYKYFKTPYPYFMHIYQPETESVLLNHLHEQGHDVERKLTLTDLSQDNNRVTATLVDELGQHKKVSAKYLVGCDGGNSAVRKLAHIELDQQWYGNHFELADVYLDWDDRKKQTHYYVGPAGYLMIVPGPDDCHRVIISNPGTDCPDIITRDMIQSWVDERGPGNIQVKHVEWFASAPFGHKIARSGHLGRIFLAGDAYHQFSPVGGINMNIGIQDAVTLAWKLNFVIQGNATSRFLDSYELERRETINHILAESRKRTEQITSSTDFSSQDIASFLPKLANRNHMRVTLPKTFSGLNDYMHASFIEPTYTNDTHHFQLLASMQLKSHLLDKIKTMNWPVVIKSTGKHHDALFLVRPDGYIAKQITTDNLIQQLTSFFSTIH